MVAACTVWAVVSLCLCIFKHGYVMIRPNILLIVADDLGYGDLAIHGHPTSLSPHLDQLFASSLDLRRFYVVSPVCSPSRSAILTGKYPVSTGVWPGVFEPNSIGGLDPIKHKTLAYHLRRLGYQTGHIGKWHLGVGLNGQYLPTKQGFDRYLGIPYSHDMCPCLKCHGQGNQSCFGYCRQDLVNCPLYLNEQIVEQPTDLPALTDKYTQAAMRFVKASNGRPFFLYLAYHQTHHPQFSKDDPAASERWKFGAALTEMDASIGNIVQAIKDLDIMNNTLILFTSDNGPSLTRHQRGGCSGLLRCGKGVTWEGGIRVPTFVHWQGNIFPRKSNLLWSSLDILPTILGLLQEKLPKNLPGKDHSKHVFALNDQGFDDEDHAVAQFGTEPDPKVGAMAILWKHYKAHFNTKGNSLSDDENFDWECTSKAKLTPRDPPLIYDLNTDPGERYPLKLEENVALFAKLKDIRAGLEKDLAPWSKSEMKKGTNRAVLPCCGAISALCEPFPTCCDCTHQDTML